MTKSWASRDATQRRENVVNQEDARFDEKFAETVLGLVRGVCQRLELTPSVIRIAVTRGLYGSLNGVCIYLEGAQLPINEIMLLPLAPSRFSVEVTTFGTVNFEVGALYTIRTRWTGDGGG